MKPKTIRAFLALRLNHEIQNTIQAIQNTFKQLPVDVKWVRPENTHLTLKFLGDISSEQIDLLTPALHALAGSTKSFSLETTGIGAFPSRERPRIIWLGCRSEADAAALLTRRVENQLVSFGFERDQNPFTPHITIGRVRSSKNLVLLSTAIEKAGRSTGLRQDISQIILFQSTLSSCGPSYTPIRTFQLAQ